MAPPKSAKTSGALKLARRRLAAVRDEVVHGDLDQAQAAFNNTARTYDASLDALQRVERAATRVLASLHEPIG